MGNTITFFLFILLAIVIGTKMKINIGLVALGFAFIIGTTAGGLSANGVVSLFPTALFFNFLIVTFLFGFAGSNGTLKKVAEHLIYSCRNAGWLLGLLFFFVTVIVAGLGAGGAAPFFMSAICFSLAIQAGIRPLLVPVAVASSYVVDFFVFRAVFYTIRYLVMFIVLRGYRVNKASVSHVKPEPFDTKQKVTLGVILGIILGIVIPAAVQLILPNPVTAWLSDKCSFQLMATFGIILNIVWKTAPYEYVLKEKVPWDTLVLCTEAIIPAPISG